MNNMRALSRMSVAVGTVTALTVALVVGINVAGASGDLPAAVPAAVPGIVPAAEPEVLPAPPVTVAVVRPVSVQQTLATPPTLPTQPTLPPVVIDRIVVVGDSLADESAPVIDFITPDQPVIRKHMGGTAPCDWTSADLEATPTSVVVITFTGNNMTPCMLDESGQGLTGQRLVDKYRADVALLVEHARAAGAWVVLVGQAEHSPRLESQVGGLNAAYRDLADRLPMVAFVDAGAAVEAPDGSYTDRLPCTELDVANGADCTGGTTAVRGDGLHFCPVVGARPCPVWSSGAVRYAMAIVTAVENPQQFD